MSITQKLSVVTSFGRLLFDTVIATNTFSLNGHTFTAEASGAAGDQFNVGATDEDTAANAAAAINASSTVGVDGVMKARADGAVVYVTATGVPLVLAASNTIECAWLVQRRQQFNVLATFVQTGGADATVESAVSDFAPATPAYQTIERIQGTVIKASATSGATFPVVIESKTPNQRYSIGGYYSTDGVNSSTFTPAIVYVQLPGSELL